MIVALNKFITIMTPYGVKKLIAVSIDTPSLCNDIETNRILTPRWRWLRLFIWDCVFADECLPELHPRIPFHSDDNDKYLAVQYSLFFELGCCFLLLHPVLLRKRILLLIRISFIISFIFCKSLLWSLSNVIILRLLSILRPISLTSWFLTFLWLFRSWLWWRYLYSHSIS